MKCLKGQPGLFLCTVLPIYNNLLSAITESSESITEMCLHGKQQLLGRFSTPSMSCKESLLLIRQLKQLSSLTSSLSYRVTMRMLESLARESAEQDSISPWRTRKVTRGERREAMKSKVKKMMGCNSSGPDGGSVYTYKCSILLLNDKGRRWTAEKRTRTTWGRWQ